MTTLGTLSDYLENSLINHLLRNTTFSSPASTWLALYNATPKEGRVGIEVTGDSYSRVEMLSSAWTVTGNTATNTNTISFPIAAGDWGDITGMALLDSNNHLTSNILFYGEIENTINITTGENYTINPGKLLIKLSGTEKGGWGNNVPGYLLSHILRNTTFAGPAAQVYTALGRNLVVDTDNNFVSWAELSGAVGGYARQQTAGTSFWSAPTSGSTSNLSTCVFHNPPISASWGSVTHIVIYNNSSGQALMWGKLRTPIWIGTGDGLKFDPGNIRVEIN